MYAESRPHPKWRPPCICSNFPQVYFSLVHLNFYSCGKRFVAFCVRMDTIGLCTRSILPFQALCAPLHSPGTIPNKGQRSFSYKCIIELFTIIWVSDISHFGKSFQGSINLFCPMEWGKFLISHVQFSLFFDLIHVVIEAVVFFDADIVLKCGTCLNKFARMTAGTSFPQIHYHFFALNF